MRSLLPAPDGTPRPRAGGALQAPLTALPPAAGSAGLYSPLQPCTVQARGSVARTGAGTPLGAPALPKYRVGWVPQRPDPAGCRFPRATLRWLCHRLGQVLAGEGEKRGLEGCTLELP